MLLQLAGWSGLTKRLAGDPVSRAILRKKGMGVAVSAVSGPVGTGYGVFTMNGSAVAAVVSGAAVLALIMYADRYYIFAADTQTKVKWTGLFRLPLVLLLAVLTAYAIFVFLNLRQLDAVAADMRLERSTARQTAFDGATGLGAARTADTAAAAKLAALREQRLTLPTDIAARKTAAAGCAAAADRRLDALLRQGVRRRNAQVAVADARHRCAQHAKDAAAAERTYIASVDADIERAQDAASETGRELKAAAKVKGTLVEQANAIDADAVEPTSLAVGKRYLSNNWLALIELSVIYMIVVVADGAGLLMASFLERSPAGWQFERDRLHESAPTAADTAIAHQQIVQAEGLMRQAAKAATADDAVTHLRAEIAETQRVIATVTADAQRRAAPLLAVAASINAVVVASIEAHDAARRAHEISPALGRVADAMIARAANEVMRKMAA